MSSVMEIYITKISLQSCEYPHVMEIYITKISLQSCEYPYIWT
jgi:hypothetical protein